MKTYLFKSLIAAVLLFCGVAEVMSATVTVKTYQVHGALSMVGTAVSNGGNVPVLMANGQQGSIFETQFKISAAGLPGGTNFIYIRPNGFTYNGFSASGNATFGWTFISNGGWYRVPVTNNVDVQWNVSPPTTVQQWQVQVVNFDQVPIQIFGLSNTYFTITPPVLSVSAGSLTLPGNGGNSAAISVNNIGGAGGNNIKYTVSDNQSWATPQMLSQGSFGYSGEAFVMNVSPNLSGAIRSVDVTVTAQQWESSFGAATSPQTIRLTQPVGVAPNQPPNAPTMPNGVTSAAVGQAVNFTTVASDPDGNAISVEFEWGDGLPNGATASQSSGTTFTSPFHTYSSSGTKSVRVRAYDGLLYSAWSASSSITIAASAPSISLSGNLAFGNVQVNTTSSPRSLRITNTGNATLNVSSITYPNAVFSGAGNFAITAGSFRDVSVTFLPTAAITYSGNLTVNSNSASGTNILAISGTGTSVAPLTYTITINSEMPTSGVPITITPDNSSQGNDSTPFLRTYNTGTSVTLTAPPTAGGNTFQKWRRGGTDYTTLAISFTVNANDICTAVYAPVTPFSVQLSQPLNGTIFETGSGITHNLIATTSGGTPFQYAFSFSTDGGSTFSPIDTIPTAQTTVSLPWIPLPLVFSMPETVIVRVVVINVANVPKEDTKTVILFPRDYLKNKTLVSPYEIPVFKMPQGYGEGKVRITWDEETTIKPINLNPNIIPVFTNAMIPLVGWENLPAAVYKYEYLTSSEAPLSPPVEGSFQKVNVSAASAITYSQKAMLLIHGVNDDKAAWNNFANVLKTDGRFRDNYDLFTLEYPNRGHIVNSATGLKKAIQKILESQPTKEIDIIAHSMGGLVTRAYVQGLAEELNDVGASYDASTAKVGSFCMIATPNKGASALGGLFNRYRNFGFGIGGFAGKELEPGSSVINELKNSPILDEIRRTVILGEIKDNNFNEPTDCYFSPYLNANGDGVVTGCSAFWDKAYLRFMSPDEGLGRVYRDHTNIPILNIKGILENKANDPFYAHIYEFFKNISVFNATYLPGRHNTTPFGEGRSRRIATGDMASRSLKGKTSNRIASDFTESTSGTIEFKKVEYAADTTVLPYIGTVTDGNYWVELPKGFQYVSKIRVPGLDSIITGILDLTDTSTTRTKNFQIEARADTGYVGPTNIGVSINEGAFTTTSPFVTMSFSAMNAADIRFSEDASELETLAWSPFIASQSSILSLIDSSLKIIYVQYRNSMGVSPVISTGILYNSGVGGSASISANVDSAIVMIDGVILIRKTGAAGTPMVIDGLPEGTHLVSVFKPGYTTATGEYAVNVSASLPQAVNATFEIDTPLPVTLTAFSGTNSENGVRLGWTTATEKDNAGFVVLRDGAPIATYQTVSELRGRGTTSAQTDYSFVDNAVEVGGSYTYKLRSVDLSGQIHDYSQKVQVNVENGKTKVYTYRLEQNYPNPFNSSTVIRFSLQRSSLATMTIYDILGRVVRQESLNGVAGENIYRLNLNTLTSGVYFYQLQAGAFTARRKMLLLK